MVTMVTDVWGYVVNVKIMPHVRWMTGPVCMAVHQAMKELIAKHVS